MSVDLCLEGDADDPTRTPTLQVYLPGDAWLQLTDVASLRTMAETLIAAADSAELELARSEDS